VIVERRRIKDSMEIAHAHLFGGFFYAWNIFIFKVEYIITGLLILIFLLLLKISISKKIVEQKFPCPKKTSKPIWFKNGKEV